MMKKFFLTVCIVSMALSGCKSKQTAETSPAVIGGNVAVSTVKEDTGLTGRKWNLTELAGKEVESQQKAFILLLDAPDNSVSGNLGCNDFAGSYTLQTGNRIRFSNLAVTQKMCLNGMEVEDELKRVLGMADSYHVSGTRLVLNRARMAPLAVFTLAEQ